MHLMIWIKTDNFINTILAYHMNSERTRHFVVVNLHTTVYIVLVWLASVQFINLLHRHLRNFIKKPLKFFVVSPFQFRQSKLPF